MTGPPERHVPPSPRTGTRALRTAGGARFRPTVPSPRRRRVQAPPQRHPGPVESRDSAGTSLTTGTRPGPGDGGPPADTGSASHRDWGLPHRVVQHRPHRLQHPNPRDQLAHSTERTCSWTLRRCRRTRFPGCGARCSHCQRNNSSTSIPVQRHPPDGVEPFGDGAWTGIDHRPAAGRTVLVDLSLGRAVAEVPGPFVGFVEGLQ